MIPESATSALLLLRSTDGRARLMRIDAQVDTTRVWPPASGVPALGAPFDAASDGAGGAFVVWLDYRMGPTHWGRVAVLRLDAAGAPAPGWPDSGVVLSLPDVQTDNLHVLADDAHGAFVAWDQVTNGPAAVAAQHVDALGATAAPVPVVLVASTASQRLASLALGVGGNALVALEDGRNSGDIYAQLLTPALGRSWGVNGFAASATTGIQRYPVIASDRFGGALIAWEDARASGLFDQRLDVYVTRADANGTRSDGWITHGNLVAPGRSLIDVHVVPDGLGGGFVASVDEALPSSPLRVDRVAAGGSVDSTWCPTRFPASGTATANHRHPSDMIADGRGGLFLAWSTGGAAYVLELGVDGAAAPGWPAGGERADAGQGPIARVSLAAGGAGAAWLAFESKSGLPCTPGEVCYDKRAWGGRVESTSLVGAPPAASLTGLRLAAPMPNPSSGLVHVEVDLPSSASAQLALYNVAGRRVALQALSGLAGKRRVTLALPPGLAPGIYALRLTQGRESTTASVCVLR